MIDKSWPYWKVVLYGAPLGMPEVKPRTYWFWAKDVDAAVRGAMAEDPYREWVHQVGVAR